MGHVYIKNRIRGKKKSLLTRYFAYWCRYDVENHYGGHISVMKILL